MKEHERCRHPDCIYRNHADPEMSGRCHYWMITGRCRIVGLPERLQLPCNCPYYEPGGGKPKPALSDWREKAWALYEAGATDKEIAEAVGKSVITVRDYRRRAWAAPPNPDKKGPGTRFDWKKAKELHRRGLNDAQIAREIGCSPSTVRNWRFKQNLFSNDQRGRKGDE